MVHVIPKSGFANTYLIEEDDGLIAVDVGSIGAAQKAATYCTGILKRSLEDIRFIFTTHFHIDHIGGIGTLLKGCSPETTVLFDLHAKGYIEERENLVPMKNWLSGLVPTIRENYTCIGNLSHIAFESLAGVPLPVFKDNGRLPYTDRVSYIDMQGALLSRIGFSDWEAVPTPGHTPDSISLYNEKTYERKRLTESSLPGVANGVSLPKVEYFHNREVADDDRRTERPLAGHHRQADGERSERGGILPGGTHPRGSILFLAPQIQ